MVPRRGFWIILAGQTPTAFRARERDDLVPTLRQLQRTQPDVSLRWFEHNKVWESPAHAREARRPPRAPRKSFGREWRPGGDHRDPRARFKQTRDQKRARFKRNRQRSADSTKSRSSNKKQAK